MQQAHRLKQLIDIALIGTTIGILLPLFDGKGVSVMLLCLSAIMLAFARRLTANGSNEGGFLLIAWTLAFVMSYITWSHNGLRDVSLITYPPILMMVTIVRKMRHLFGMVAFFTASLLTLFLLNKYGLYKNTIQPVTVTTFIQIALILITSTAMIWAISRDYTSAYFNLQALHNQALASQAQIEFMAQHDNLTGLPTRSLARDRFESMIEESAKLGRQCALLFMDIDNFKAINDAMGHKAGDQYLLRVADVLRESVSDKDTACRQSGDEFLLLLNNIKCEDSIAAYTDALLERLRTPFEIDGIDLSISCSVGIAIYPQHGDSYDEVIKNADTAMYKAKESGRNGFCFYDAESHGGVKHNIHLMAGLRNAIQNGELILHYQPQFDLKSEKLIGAEALVRWNHPTQGLLSPLTFIHLAETSGMINDLGNWVLNEACRQNNIWRQKGTDLVMSINLSPMQFRRNDLHKTIAMALEKTGLPGKNLELELTESLFVDDTEMVGEMLTKINEMGVLMSIDDFGTGYSNLSYLRRLPVQQLKIDQSFVRNMDHNNEALINVIIQMAENFSLISIAEGIEDEDTMKRLRDMGCQRGQGYYWDRPLTADRFEEKYVVQGQQLAA
jgi:diguanylate cyclase (GGDEF)-like protein